ncbi:MAG: TetR/AcrR family transcriptional regulator [Anaerovoracaceae bacterium]|jgi:AcrR family transcriptional regulator
MSLREKNKIKCRANILKTSRRLFREKGYEKTTIDEIAHVAEISRGTFYNYFPDKESLLMGTAREEIESWENYIRRWEGEAWEERLRKAMIFLILDARPNLDLSKRILWLASDPAGPMHPVEEELSHVLRRVVTEGEGSRMFREGVQTEEVMDALIGLYYLGIFRWGKEEEETVVKKINDALDIIIRGIKDEQ